MENGKPPGPLKGERIKWKMENGEIKSDFYLCMSKKSCTFASGKLLFTHSEQYRMAK